MSEGASKTLMNPASSGWLGNFYLPTNSPLINASALSAADLGLFHFTTQTNQTKEGSTLLDIGYHYVAVDSNGKPIDSNATLPVKIIRSPQESLRPYFFFIGQSNRRALSRLALSGQLPVGAKRW